MSTPNLLPQPVARRQAPAGALSPLHFLVLSTVAVGVMICAVAFLFGGERVQFQWYLALLVFYSVGTGVFVVSRIRRAQLQLFELPVFITLLFFIQYGIVPLRNFLDPSQMD